MKIKKQEKSDEIMVYENLLEVVKQMKDEKAFWDRYNAIGFQTARSYLFETDTKLYEKFSKKLNVKVKKYK